MNFKFCPECGFKFDKDYKFCPECGYKLGGAGASAPEPLFDFSDDTAQYGGFDEQLKKNKQDDAAAIEERIKQAVAAAVAEEKKKQSEVAAEHEAKKKAEEEAKKKAAGGRTKSFEVILDGNELRRVEKSWIDDLQEYDEERVGMSRRKRMELEKKLAEEFNRYFLEYAELGPQNGITFVRDVSPQYFGEHPKDKPIHFLFRKNGRDVLAVAILTVVNYKHMAVTSIKEACERKMKYLRFFVGYPNTEHYVVRRVLEELGLIERVY